MDTKAVTSRAIGFASPPPFEEGFKQVSQIIYLKVFCPAVAVGTPCYRLTGSVMKDFLQIIIDKIFVVFDNGIKYKLSSLCRLED